MHHATPCLVILSSLLLALGACGDKKSSVQEATTAEAACESNSDCQQGEVCLTHHLWLDLSDRIHGFLSDISLAQLVGRREVQRVSARQDARSAGVDALAVSIGTAHGVYRSEPVLNIERLKELDAASTVPLVLHGGSGTPDDPRHITWKP